MRLHMSTEHVAEHARFAMWREMAGGFIGAVSELPSAQSGSFQARISARSSGPLLNLHFVADAHRVIRRDFDIARRPRNSYRIYREDSAGGWFSLPAASS